MMQYLGTQNKIVAHCSFKKATHEPILLVLKVNLFVSDSHLPANMVQAFNLK
jgi:hypothetical protein